MKIEAPRSLITHKIRGKKIDFVGVKGDYLVIATTDGQLYRIGWRDDQTQELVPGEPSLEGIDVSLEIDPVGGVGAVFGL